MNVVIFGFKYAGKTHYGKLLAKKLKMPFLDTDELLENLFYKSKNQKMTVREIYQAVGPQMFRALESEVLLSLQSVQHSVIALGGGAVLDPANTEILLKMGVLIFLDTPKQVIKKRMFEDSETPAFLGARDPEAAFDIMYDERIPIYSRIPAAHITTEKKTDAKIVDEIAGILKLEKLERKENEHGK